MRIVIQRVKKGKVVVDNTTVGCIDGGGAVVLFGAHQDDFLSQTKYLANKLVNLRMFPDDLGKMNLSLKDVKKEVLIVSQFTLYADCNAGRRPSFIDAAMPNEAKMLYEQFVEDVKNLGIHVETGIFGANMEVTIINDGPVTFIIDAKNSL